MTIGVILPHSKLYGGVKRFFELGNFFVADGHRFIVFNEKGDTPDWFIFNGEITKLSEIGNYQFDAVFFTEPRYYSIVAATKSKRKIYYFVKSNEKLKAIVKDRSFELFANSTNLYNEAVKRYGVKPFKAFGGIDTNLYQPKHFEPREPNDPFVVLAYGRLTKKKKGTMYVVKACERVYKKHKNLKLILFDTIVDSKSEKAIENFKCKVPYEFIINQPIKKNPELFKKAHVFVSAEYKAGYCNTASEAMASGTTVIATKSGTLDILTHENTGLVVRRNRFSISWAIMRLIKDEALRLQLAKSARKNIETYSWENLYAEIADELNDHTTSPTIL